ncbi:MAG: hypothetical protein ACKOPO_04375 [Novosphingobium sp.]
MLDDITQVYRASRRAAAIAPLLFLIPAVAEFFQHVVEMRIGMYDSLAAAKAVANDPQRMQAGFAKTIALLLPGYWFVRLMAFGDAARAKRIEQPAFGLWLVLLAFGVALLAWELFGPKTDALLSLQGKAGALTGPILSGLWMVIGVYLTGWYNAWPLGNARIGPVSTFALMAGTFWRTVGITLACIVPLMVLHYALGFLAIAVTPAALDWVVLAVDAIAVSLLACTMAGSGYVAAAHAARRKGVSLAG